MISLFAAVTCKGYNKRMSFGVPNLTRASAVMPTAECFTCLMTSSRVLLRAVNILTLNDDRSCHCKLSTCSAVCLLR